MRRYEKKRRSETVNKLVEVRCDICGRVAPNSAAIDERYWSSVDSEFDDLSGSYAATKVFMDTGWGCSDGGSGYKLEVDICPDCFLNKLMPALGVEKFRRAEWDW